MAKLQEAQLHQIIIAEKVWTEVGKIVEEFKRDTWKRLVDTKQEDNFLELIRWELLPWYGGVHTDPYMQYTAGARSRGQPHMGVVIIKIRLPQKQTQPNF